MISLLCFIYPQGSVIEHVHEDIDVARLRDDARHRRAENDTDRLEEAGAHEDRDERHHRARKVVQDVVADCLGRANHVYVEAQTEVALSEKR